MSVLWPNLPIQWNASTKATLGAKPKWPLQRGGLYRGVHLARKVVLQTDSIGPLRWGGLSRGWLFVKGFYCIHV